MATTHYIASALPADELRKVMSDILEAWPELADIFQYHVEEISDFEPHDIVGCIEEGTYLMEPKSYWVLFVGKHTSCEDVDSQALFCDLVYHILGRKNCKIEFADLPYGFGYSLEVGEEEFSLQDVTKNYLKARRRLKEDIVKFS